MPDAHRIAGLKVLDASLDEGLNLLWEDASSGQAHVYVLVNAYSATLRRQNPAYADLLEAPAVVGLPDGAPVAWGAVLEGRARLGRCPGPDLFAAACARAAGDGTPMFLLGGGPGVADDLADKLREAHPWLSIVGTATPPFGEWPAEASRDLVGAVRSSGAKILWLGVSAPKQECWSVAHLGELGIPVVCVGAAFDFLSGRKPRAPKWMRQAGLEWAYRLSTEPTRLWMRYLIGNSVFLLDLLKHGAHAVVPEED